MKKEVTSYKNNINSPKRFTKKTIGPENNPFTIEGEGTIDCLIAENRATRKTIFLLLKKLNDIEALLIDRDRGIF